MPVLWPLSPLLLADEPTGNLDSQTGEGIMQLFTDLHQRGTTILVVTHSRDIAAYTNRVIEMKDGQIISDSRYAPRNLDGIRGAAVLHVSDSIDIGVKGLLLRKLRALLSTLGIVFGVAAFISMMAIGEGARREAVDQIKLLGTNNIRIKQLQLTGEKRKRPNAALQSLTYHDSLLIQTRFPTLVGVTPMKFVDAEVRFEGRQGVAQVIGISPV